MVLFCCPKYYKTENKELYNLQMLFKLWGNRKEEFRDDKARDLHLQSQILSSLGTLEYLISFKRFDPHPTKNYGKVCSNFMIDELLYFNNTLNIICSRNKNIICLQINHAFVDSSTFVTMLSLFGLCVRT